jgi:lipopolysaccharide export system permease protein
MKMGLLMMAAAIVLGEGLAPEAERYAQNMRAAALSEEITLKTGDGLWARDGQQFIHVANLFPDGTLGNIAIYEFDNERRLHKVTKAERAVYEGEGWTLRNIQRTTLNRDQITTEVSPRAEWTSLLNPRLVAIVSVRPELLSAWGLYQYVGYLKENGLSSERYEQALGRKIIAPLSTGVMVFLAIPFVFGPLRSVAIGQRVLVGASVGIGYYVADQMMGYLGLVFDVPPLVSILLPPLAFLTLAIALIRRVR